MDGDTTPNSVAEALHDRDMHRVFDRYLDYIVGHFTEQCNDNIPLPLMFTCNDDDPAKVVGNIRSISRYVVTLPHNATHAKIDEVVTEEIVSKPTPTSTLSGVVSDDEHA